jgi:soluble lytic murein transglycosylase-like protein
MKTPKKHFFGKEMIYSCLMIVAMLFIGKYHNFHFVQPQANTASHSASSSEVQSNAVPTANYNRQRALDNDRSTQSEKSVPVSQEPLKMEQQTTKYYEVPLAANLQDLILSECKAKDVSPDLVIALIDVESNFNPKCISKTNDYGLMQINICHKDSLKQEIQVTNLLDEKQNIKAGVHMLSEIGNKYNNLNQALMVYNCGETGAKKLWNNGIYSTAYSRKVITKIDEIKR